MQSQDIAVEEVFGANALDLQTTQETYAQQNCVAQTNEHIAQIPNQVRVFSCFVQLIDCFQTGKPFATANGHLVQMTADLSLGNQQPPDQRNVPTSSSNSSMSIHRAIDPNIPGPSHRPEPDPVLFEDDADDLTSVSRVRLVQFQKDTGKDL